jgi:hypothetical protein
LRPLRILCLKRTKKILFLNSFGNSLISLGSEKFSGVILDEYKFMQIFKQSRADPLSQGVMVSQGPPEHHTYITDPVVLQTTEVFPPAQGTPRFTIARPPRVYSGQIRQKSVKVNTIGPTSWTIIVENKIQADIDAAHIVTSAL